MSDVTVANVMAIRAAILDRNAALRTVVPATQAGEPTASAVAAPAQSFAATLETAFQKVNANLEREDVATEAYERGETTDIATVAIMQARASVSFEATLQLRNKLLSAYKDIISMQV